MITQGLRLGMYSTLVAGHITSEENSGITEFLTKKNRGIWEGSSTVQKYLRFKTLHAWIVLITLGINLHGSFSSKELLSITARPEITYNNNTA